MVRQREVQRQSFENTGCVSNTCLYFEAFKTHTIDNTTPCIRKAMDLFVGDSARIEICLLLECKSCSFVQVFKEE